MTVDMEPMVSALLGWMAGFVTSIPGGPVNATIVAEAPRRGLRWVVFLVFGAVTMDAIYCWFAFAGFARFFESHWIRATMELVSFLLMLWLGFKYVRGTPIPGEQRMEHFVQERFHPHTAFWMGFLRVLGNPGVLLLWITVAATVLSREWVENRWASKWAFIGAMAVGSFNWFTLVGWGVTRGQGRFEERTLKRFEQGSGVFLLLVAAVVGWRLVQLLAERHGVK